MSLQCVAIQSGRLSCATMRDYHRQAGVEERATRVLVFLITSTRYLFIFMLKRIAHRDLGVVGSMHNRRISVWHRRGDG